MKERPKLLVIVGATATGKSALAIELAERFGGEILCADSRTVYRGMDVGTAKPTADERARVRHWGLDLVSLDEPFTAADFKSYAEQAIADITGRDKLPIMVGGSGLYIDGVLYDYNFRPVADVALRTQLEGLSVARLQERVLEMGLELPENARNPRFLIRTIEAGVTGGGADRQRGMRPNILVLGLDYDIGELERRIAARTGVMVDSGLVEEVKRLGECYGWETQALQAPGYREFRGYFEGTQTLEQTRAEIVKNTRAFAKRQKTWFKRNKSIHWLMTEDKMAQAVALTTTFLDT